MKNVKWLIQYDTYDSKENRICGLSSLGVCDYKVSLLTRKGYFVDIISPSVTGHKWGFYGYKVKNLTKQVKLHLFPTFGYVNKAGMIFSKLWTATLLFFYLLLFIKRNEIIIVAHSLAFCTPLYIAKKIKGFKILLDFGEEYNKVKKGNLLYRIFEPKLISVSDEFIFCNDLMSKLYNSIAYTVIYGQYINPYKLPKKRKKDNKIHLVYAGIISKEEGSAYQVIKLARFLDERYRIHILGQIPKEEDYLALIKENNEKHKCKIQYEGIKKGESFFNELNKYDIGLNLRKTSEKYIDFAFPSKCLTYLCAGLRVVSSDIKCLKESRLAEAFFFFKDNSLENASEVIRQIDIYKNYEIKNQLETLDIIASDELAHLIGGKNDL